jgi:hypothetical protein
MKIIPTVVAVLTLCAAANAFSGKTKLVNPGAIVQFAACAQDDTACRSANRVRSDGDGSYTNGSQGVSAVFNLVSGSRDLTFSSGTRSVTFDFSEAFYTMNAPSWWYASPVQSIKPFMNVGGAYFAKEQCGTATTCNINYVTRLNAGQWSIPGSSKTTYAILWNPDPDQPRPVNSPYSTSPVNVNYVKDSSGERFIITPLQSSDCGVGSSCEADPIIAGLEVTSGRSVTSGGQYHMPFTMTVTLQ